MLSRRLLRIKAVQSLYAALERGENGNKTLPAVNELTKSADQCYQLYLTFLDLIVSLRNYANERIEIGKNKFHPSEAELNPNTRFVENPVIAKIADAIAPFSDKLPIQWSDQKEIISELFNEMIAEDYYSVYMSLEHCTLASHKKVLESFLINNLVDNENIEKIIEEISIFWVDDIDYAASFVSQTIRDYKKDEDIIILEKYRDEDVADFGKDLIRFSLEQYDTNLQYIIDNCHNWEPDRIACMDRILLLVAIAEIRNFPSIPVKVSMDEFIEISKFYSTDDSSVFINGMLEKIVHDLDANGLIHKSGRGLLQ